MQQRYERATSAQRTELLTEMAAMTGHHRKALIRVMNRPTAARGWIGCSSASSAS